MSNGHPTSLPVWPCLFALTAMSWTMIVSGASQQPGSDLEENVATTQDFSSVTLPEVPGRLVDVGGYRLHLLCAGQGSPTVMLEAGLGGFSLEWDLVQRELARDVRVCSYDRGGYGWSDPGPAPRTAERLVDELQRLLKAAGESGPYLFVGHSFGGYLVQLFVKHYPQLTAGVVLVDSSHPLQYERFPRAHQALYERAARRRTWGSAVQLPPGYPLHWRAVAEVVSHQPKTLRAVRLEYRAFIRSGEQVAEAGAMPDVPAVVLTRGRREWPDSEDGDAMEAIWPELQRELAESMPRARHFTIGASGHHIHLDEPAAVDEAVRLVIEQADCGPAVASAPADGRAGSC